MNKDSNRYVLLFGLGICVICSLLLSGVAEGLRSRIERNEALAARQEILAVAGQPLPDPADAQSVLAVYRQVIEEAGVNPRGEIIVGPDGAPGSDQGQSLPLYIYRVQGAVRAYIFPVEGPGLWSTLYGYLAVEPDGRTVRGITFYKEAETPGLGGEVRQAWFQDNFRGKQIWDPRTRLPRAIEVIKGRVAERIPADQQAFYVDGISGATMTSQGVTALLADWLRVYDPFLERVRQQQGGAR